MKTELETMVFGFVRLPGRLSYHSFSYLMLGGASQAIEEYFRSVRTHAAMALLTQVGDRYPCMHNFF